MSQKIDCTINTRILKAAKEENWDEVMSLLRDGADVNAKNDIGDTPLFWATKSGNLAVVQLLVERHGADVNVEDSCNDTPLLLAAKNDHWDVVKFLVEHRAREVRSRKTDKEFQEFINKKDADGNPPIAYAAFKGNTDAFKFLFKYGADVNTRCVHCYTPMMLAAENGHEEIVRFLLEQPIPFVSAVNVDCETALRLAEKNNHQNIVALLRKYIARKPLGETNHE